MFWIYSQSAKGDLLGGLALPLSEADLFGMKYTLKIDTDIEKLKVMDMSSVCQQNLPVCVYSYYHPTYRVILHSNIIRRELLTYTVVGP